MNKEAIKRDIDRLFGDTSVSLSQTRSDLEDIADHVQSLLDALSEDED